MTPAPRIVAFFVPLPESVGVPHGSIHSFDEGQTIPGIEPGPVFLSDQSPPVPGRTADRLFVSLKWWRVRATMVDLAEQWRALDIVMEVVTGKARPERAQDSDALSTTLTVVEAVTLLLPSETDPPSAAFDRCLARMNQVVMAYGIVAQHGVAPVTRQRMPDHVPMAVRELTGTWSEISLFVVGFNNVRRYVPPELDADGQARVIQMIGGIVAGDPVVPYLELSREARRAFDRLGDTRAAVIYAASACEVLLDSVLQSMLWEEGVTPEEAVERYFAPNSTLGGRVKRSDTYAPRLGTGQWRLHGDGPVAAWYETLADLRNRCVHAGHTPSQPEALAASRAQFALRDFIADRLVARQRSYPRTAALFTNRAKASPTRDRDISEVRSWRAEFAKRRTAAE